MIVEIGGSSTKMVRAVFKKAKLDYQIYLYPWARSYETALRKKNTMIYSILKTPEREALFKWVCPISQQVKLYLYKLKKRQDVQINAFEQAKQYTIGVTRNDFPHIRLKQLGFEDHHLFLSPDDKSNIKMLLNSRIDFVVESADTIKLVLKQSNHSMDDVFPVMQLAVGQKNANCMAFNLQTDDKIVNKVRAALKVLLQKQSQ